MKKLFALFLTSLFAVSIVNAQEAFQSLGASIEVGTTGAGVNISLPIVTDHWILSIGANFPSISYKTNYNIDGGDLNSKISELNSSINELNKKITKFKELNPTAQVSTIDNVKSLSNNNVGVDATAEINMVNFKVMFEYYPSSTHSFHITAGVFIGSSEFFTVNGTVDDDSWSTYQSAINTNNQLINIEKELEKYENNPFAGKTYHVDGLEDVLRFSIDDRTFAIDSKSKHGKADARIFINGVKPYLGVGFGRSIPRNHRFGFQCEIGAWYHGKAKLESPNEIAYDPTAKGVSDVFKTMNKIVVYPQLTFRMTGRFF